MARQQDIQGAGQGGCAGSTPGGVQDRGQTRTKPCLGLQGRLKQKGLRPRRSLCREQGEVQPRGQGGTGTRGNTPSPVHQEEACGHCGKLPGDPQESLVVQKQCPTSRLREGARKGCRSRVNRADTSCDPRNAKPCGTWKTNRTIHPPAGKVITKTHDSEQEPRRNSIKLSISRRSARELGTGGFLPIRSGARARANTYLVPAASASKLKCQPL